MIPLSASMLSTKKPKLSNWSLACRKVLPVGGIFFAWDFFCAPSYALLLFIGGFSLGLLTPASSRCSAEPSLLRAY